MKRFPMICLTVAMLNLGGCAQIANFSSQAWTSTKSFTQKNTDKILSFLRPRSELSEPIFIDDPFLAEYEGLTQSSDAHMAQMSTQDSLEPLPVAPPHMTGQPISVEIYPQSQHNEYADLTVSSVSSDASPMVVATQTYTTAPSYHHNTYNSYPHAGITQESYDYASTAGQDFMASSMSTDLSQELPDLSYVKLNGQPSVLDWQNCQAQAGGYIIANETGFHVRPDFDYCMRVNGYVPERDAIGFLNTEQLP